MCFISLYSVLTELPENIYVYISKNIASYTFLLVFKIVKSLKKLDFDNRGSVSYDIFGWVLSQFIERIEKTIYSTYKSVEL